MNSKQTASKTAQKIAIIPDGNRRFAQINGISLPQAYSVGVSKVEEVAGWAQEKNIKSMTFWALSLENLQKRSSLEISMLYKLMENQITKAIESEKFSSKNIKVKFFGKKELLPKTLIEKLETLEEKTTQNKSLELNIAIAYSGQEEIIYASKSIARDILEGKININELETINAEVYQKYLYSSITPDLIIRTGNVQRLSGFLPFQSAYSEYYFCQSLWPEFSKNDFDKSLQHYQFVNRRFGK